MCPPRAHLLDAVEGRLDRLQVDHIDLYQLHGFDVATPIDETLRALDDLVGQGLVRYVGVSNWAAWQIAKALGISEANGYARFETLQAYYAIAGRDLERELAPMLGEEKLGLMVCSPLAPLAHRSPASSAWRPLVPPARPPPAQFA